MRTLIICFGMFMTGIVSAMIFLAPAHYDPQIAELQKLADECPEKMVCYHPYGAPVTPEYILDGTMVKINFVSVEELGDKDGWAEYQVDFENNVSFCIITTSIPQQVLGDPQMDTLGHELLHCLVGSFHP